MHFRRSPPPLWSCSDLLGVQSRQLSLLVANAMEKFQTLSYW